jgi:hypothetical protein
MAVVRVVRASVGTAVYWGANAMGIDGTKACDDTTGTDSDGSAAEEATGAEEFPEEAMESDTRLLWLLRLRRA